MKKILITLSLLIIVSALYFYRSNIATFLKVKNTDISVPLVGGETSSDKILDINRSYKDLTAYEKSIVDSFLKANPIIDNQLIEGYGDTEIHKNYIKLKFYVNNIAVFYVPSGKGVNYVVNYNVKTKETKEYQDIYVFGNTVESDKYIVFLNEGNYEQGIQYLKLGDFDLKNVPNSKLTKGETYVKQGGMMNVYESSISRDILKISVFKDEQHVDTPNTKLREVTFVLP